MKCQKGDELAFQAFYKKYLPYILTIIRRYGINKDQEADLVQDIFIEIFNNIHKYKSTKGKMSSWLRSITVHIILNYKRSKIRLVFLEQDQLEYIRNEQELDYQQHSPTYILKYISELPDGYKTIFNLYEVDGYSHKEIAKMLDISPEGSRSQLSRARALLRTKLNKLKI